MTDGYYVPEPLLEAVRDMLTSVLPGGIEAGLAVTEPPTRHVNLWPGTPLTEQITMYGPTFATISVQATSLAPSPTEARKLGALVRKALGKDRKGAFNNPITATGFKVMDIVASGGRDNGSGGIGAWVEMYDITYQVA